MGTTGEESHVVFEDRTATLEDVQAFSLAVAMLTGSNAPAMAQGGLAGRALAFSNAHARGAKARALEAWRDGRAACTHEPHLWPSQEPTAHFSDQRMPIGRWAFTRPTNVLELFAELFALTANIAMRVRPLALTPRCLSPGGGGVEGEGCGGAPPHPTRLGAQLLVPAPTFVNAMMLVERAVAAGVECSVETVRWLTLTSVLVALKEAGDMHLTTKTFRRAPPAAFPAPPGAAPRRAREAPPKRAACAPHPHRGGRGARQAGARLAAA
jgi:hypothetical protein